MTRELSVKETLFIANKTGQQVTIGLNSGKNLEGVIVEELWPTSFRVWLEPAEPVEPGQDIDKAIVGTYAVKSVEFGIAADEDNHQENNENNTMAVNEKSKMCIGKFIGILEALEYALLTEQTVNVGLNRNGKAVTVEGKIVNVDMNSFRISLEKTGKVETIAVSEVEYVEYS